MKHSDSAYALGAQGPFADRIKGFAVRDVQLSMARAVETAISERTALVVEAGTGTGKTYAYLVPALLCGERVIVSTGTKNLQDQLFHRDLPAVCKTLSINPKRALLKGRNNYVCLHRLEEAMRSGQLPTREAAARLRKVEEFARSSKTGDLGEHAGHQDGDVLTPMITSSRENCLGADCPQYQECFVVKARRAAMDADIVVVNHHLLLADMALKEEGFGELLPGAAAIIVDEAHQLAETASNFFGESFSSRQLLELSRDMEVATRAHAREQQGLLDALLSLKRPLQEIRLALGADRQRAPLAPIEHKPSLRAAMTEMDELLQTVRDELVVAADRDEELANGLARSEVLLQRLHKAMSENDNSQIRWYETYSTGFAFHATPLSVAEAFQRQMQRYKNAGWIFTSATLSVNREFKHFTDALGLADSQTLTLDSPFDYATQSLLYIPSLPEPDAPHYIDALCDAVVPVLNASRGRAFLLFTSYRALQAMAKKLPERISYPLLVHGDGLSRTRLLDDFRRLGNAVLLGTSSFWEGVDVQGDALSLVVIDRLPFAAPDDPVLKARIEAHRKKGGNPFNDLQVPRAVIALKQGAGRLIRDVSDTGVLMIADPRFINASYGKTFARSLPAMPLTRELRSVVNFFQANDR